MNKGFGPTGMLPAGGGRRVSPQQSQAPQPSLSPQISEKHIAKTLQSVSLTWATMVPSVEIFAR